MPLADDELRPNDTVTQFGHKGRTIMLARLTTLAATFTLVACAGAESRRQGAVATTFADGQSHIAVRVSELAFQPCSANAPGGCEMAVVEGNPDAGGTYTLRFRSATPLHIAPHSHPSSERMTVLEGTVYVGDGGSDDKSKASAFGPGDFYMFAPGAVHSLWTDGPVELQATGVGPREFHLASASPGDR
jgi:mannose-6-phosphate isomerase-like protein (cupin superfamily)